MHLLMDSRTKPSWTVSLTVPAIAILLVKFVLSGFKFGDIVFASIDVVAFGTAFAALMAPLIARDAVIRLNGHAEKPSAG